MPDASKPTGSASNKAAANGKQADPKAGAAGAAAAPAADDEFIQPIPNLDVPQALFRLVSPRSDNKVRAEAKKKIIEHVEKDEMGPYYASLLSNTLSSPHLKGSDAQARLKSLEKKNAEALEQMDQQQKVNEENEGEMEVNAVLRLRAAYLAKIGEKEKAIEAHKVAIEKAAGIGSKLDLTLAQIRIGLFHGDAQITIPAIAKAKALVEEGGDWDRRNRLKVYEGLHLLSIRSFKEGGELFLDALSTFTATEVLSLNDFVTLTVIANALSLGRVDLKKKVIDSPEVLQVIDELPHLRQLTTSLYNCEYAKFFQALAEVEQTHLLTSRVLAIHSTYYVREMRIKAYAQLLESYSSLTITSMAEAFGVSHDFVDAELSKFIASGRLGAVIDRVSGIVETRRSSGLSSAYAKVLKDGDLVLNNLQRLSRQVL